MLGAAKTSFLTDVLCYSFRLVLNSNVITHPIPRFLPSSPQGFGFSLFLLICDRSSVLNLGQIPTALLLGNQFHGCDLPALTVHHCCP